VRTAINGKDRAWPEEIQQLWHTRVENADPKWLNVKIEYANYFTPRPYVDEYNRGSRQAGFTYTVRKVESAGVPSVWQCAWQETYDPVKHDRYRA
jgi:hypothetical protein